MSELVAELEEQARVSLRHLMERVNLREDLDLLTKDEIIDTILMSKTEIKVFDLIEALKVKAADIHEEQKALEGLVRTMAMEGPNKFKDVYYRPTCKFGYADCIYDSAYIYATYPEWYKNLYGSKTPEEAAATKGNCCSYCKNGDHYDDEDK